MSHGYAELEAELDPELVDSADLFMLSNPKKKKKKVEFEVLVQ